MRYVLKGEIGRKKARERLEQLIEKGATVDLIEKRRPRTSPQNRWYWVLIQLLGIEMGYTRDEMHIVCKRELGLVYEVNGQKFLASTAKLDIAKMSEYIERLRAWAGALGYSLPSAQQYHEQQQEYDDYIDANAFVRR